MHSLLRFKFLLALLFGMGFAHATDGLLPLDAGTYVVASYTPCEEAPLAGVTSFDGASFVGPHDSDCQTTILEQHGADYRVSVRCKALGDGTPTVPKPFVEGVRIKTRTSFVLTHDDAEMEFALCPAFH